MLKREIRRLERGKALAGSPSGLSFLFRVQDTFEVKTRGLVLLPEGLPDQLVTIGDGIELRRPDGTSIRSQIQGIEQFSPVQTHFGFLIRPGVTKAEVPAGTEGWLVIPDLRGQDSAEVFAMG